MGNFYQAYHSPFCIYLFSKWNGLNHDLFFYKQGHPHCETRLIWLLIWCHAISFSWWQVLWECFNSQMLLSNQSLWLQHTMWYWPQLKWLNDLCIMLGCQMFLFVVINTGIKSEWATLGLAIWMEKCMHRCSVTFISRCKYCKNLIWLLLYNCD